MILNHCGTDYKPEPDIGYDRIPAINSLSIAINGVAKQLSLMKTNKGSGPDTIPPWFLKEYATEIAPILTNIFQDSIESGTVPSRWKSANVCGVLKKGKKSHPSNYRPITLTCIGPLLFLTYINDLPNGLTSTVKLFTNDTLLYGVVVDCDNLQDDLNKLEIWQHEWQMQFNPSKCNVICISNKQRPPERTYFFCGSKLEQVDSVSYLGITVNSKLKWSEHIQHGHLNKSFSLSNRAKQSYRDTYCLLI